MKTKLAIGLLIATVLVAGLAGTALAAPLDQAAKPGTVAGQVTSINGNTLDVQSLRGETVQVQTDAQTRFRVPGVPGATITDIKVGDAIAARGQRTNNVLHAKGVAVLPANLRDQVIGKVTSIEGSTLMLEDKDGNSVNVQTTPITLFNSPNNPNASFSDIKVGDMVVVAGVRQGDTMTAARVGFKTPPARKPGPIVLGAISAVHGSTLTLKQPFGETLTVNTNASTFVVKRGADGAGAISVSDLRVDDKVMVIGPRSAENTQMDARVIVASQGK
jgi:Cu/Ag efflux protein CusF